MRPGFELYIFDLDGTLVDSLADLSTAVNLVLKQLDLPTLPAEQIHTYVGKGSSWLLECSLKAVGADAALLSEARRHFFPIYTEHMMDETDFFPQALETLSTLSEQGARLAICTNKPFVLTDRLLKAFGVWDRFEIILGGDSLPTKKPDPAPLHHILRSCNVRADSALMVGDSTFDIQAGQGAGTWTCGVSFGNHPSKTLVDAGADFMIDSFEELLSLQATLAL